MYFNLISDQKCSETNETRKNTLEQHVAEIDDGRSKRSRCASVEDEVNKEKKCQDSANCNEKIDETKKIRLENLIPEQNAFEPIEMTKVALAELAAAAMSKGNSENSTKDLTMLQSALFTLQHQQVFQMQLIEQLQFQLAKANANKDKKRVKSKDDENGSKVSENQVSSLSDDEAASLKNSDEW